MSLLIVGFGKTTTAEVGPAGPERPCLRCSATVSYRLTRVRVWFTLFFIPLIPYGVRYLVRCPSCGTAWRIEGEDVEAALRGELIVGGR